MRMATVLVTLLACAAAARADAPPDPARAAVERGLRRLEQGAGNYTKNRQCFSCHHNAMAMLALSSARQRGFAVEPDKVKRQVEFTLETFRPKKDEIRKGQGVPGRNTTAAYALFALEAGGHAADETTASLVEFLLAGQRPDGSWPAQTNRPPTEGSAFTNTALALRAFRVYGPAKDDDKAGMLRARIDKASAKGRDWLLNNKPATTEDKMFRLRGLVAAGAEKKEIDTARDALLKEQRPDGSWSQLPDKEGDAYATGAVLMALRGAGLATTDPAYRKAVKHLLATQKEDGSWFVQTRSRPVQVFFDNGDPGGKSQFISFAATGWAVLALLEQFPPR